jgi:hypothetical protein
MDRVEILESQLALQREELKKQSDMISKMFEMMTGMHKQLSDPSPSFTPSSAPAANTEGANLRGGSSSPHRNEVIGEGSISRDIVQITQISLPPQSLPVPSTKSGHNAPVRNASAAAAPTVPVVTSKQMSSKRKAIRATRKFIKQYYDNIPLGKAVRGTGSSSVSPRGTKRPREGVPADPSNPLRPLAPAASHPASDDSSFDPSSIAVVCAIPLSNTHAGFPAGMYVTPVSMSALPVAAGAPPPSVTSAPAPASSAAGSNTLAQNPRPTGANSATARYFPRSVVIGHHAVSSAAPSPPATGDVKTDVAQCESHSDLTRMMQSKETLVERRRAVLQMLQALNQVTIPPIILPL